MKLNSSPQRLIEIALMTDRRADREDTRLYPKESLRGFFGDALSGSLLGSYFWLLQREPLTDDAVRRAKEYAEQALEQLALDGLEKFIVTSSKAGINSICVQVFNQYSNEKLFETILEMSS